jgi:hypothetical protein
MAGLTIFLSVQAVRTLRAVRLGGRFALRPYVTFLPLAYVLLIGLSFVSVHDTSDRWYVRRATMLAQSEREPGNHLVLVRYRPNHPSGDEWVFNGADLSGAKVVWARSMGEARDQRLRAYFAGRTAWELEADAEPPRLTRSSAGSPRSR